jgi:hypothetical protein
MNVADPAFTWGYRRGTPELVRSRQGCYRYWWLTQNTAVPTTRIMMKKMAQASTWLSDLAVLG